MMSKEVPPNPYSFFSFMFTSYTFVSKQNRRTLNRLGGSEFPATQKRSAKCAQEPLVSKNRNTSILVLSGSSVSSISEGSRAASGIAIRRRLIRIHESSVLKSFFRKRLDHFWITVSHFFFLAIFAGSAIVLIKSPA